MLLPSWLVPIVIRLAGFKRGASTVARAQKRIDSQLAKPAPFAPPALEGVTIERTDAEGWPVYTLTAAQPSGATVLFLHGGSYVFEISPFHWRFAADLVRTTGASIIVPIYTLAPLATAEVTVPAVARMAREASVLLGDSAGAGLALAAALELDHPVPLVLLSPWVDVSMTDPEIFTLDLVDPWLSYVGLKVAGDAYRGSLPVTDPRVSPVLGDLSSLGPMTVFTGTRDTLNADARRLAARARAAGVPVDLHEVAGMVHNYPLLPIAEADAARETVRSVLRDVGGRG